MVFAATAPLAAAWLIPTVANGLASWRLRECCQDDSIYIVSKRKELVTKVDEIAKKLGIDKKLEVSFITGLTVCAQAMGNTIFPGKAGLAIDPNLLDKLPSGDLKFLVAHELSHIKHNDTLTIPLLTGLVQLISTVALSILFPYATAISAISYTAFAVGLITFSLFSRYREECADKKAYSICSQEGKKGAINFLTNLKNGNIQYRNEENINVFSSLWRKIKVNEQGDVRWDVLHPSFQTRIDYLRAMPSQL
jgi:Zn-dependent protease with chaperone function